MNTRSLRQIIAITGFIGSIIGIYSFITGISSLNEINTDKTYSLALKDSSNSEKKQVPMRAQDNTPNKEYRSKPSENPLESIARKIEITPGEYAINEYVQNEKGEFRIDYITIDDDGNFLLYVTITNNTGTSQEYYTAGAGAYFYLSNTFAHNIEITAYGGVLEGAEIEPGQKQKGFIKFQAPLN